MLGEPTREELDVFLRTWQRAKQAYSAPVQSCYCPNCEAMGKELAALKAQPAPVQEPVAWKFYLDGCNQVVLDEDSDPVIRHNGTPLYTTPPAAQPAPVQEPFCFYYVENGEEYFAPKGAYVPDNAQPLYTTAAQPAIPDAFGTREGEHPQYIQGWNDCRAEMLKGMKP